MNNINVLQNTLFIRGRFNGLLSRMTHAVLEIYNRHATLKTLSTLDRHMLDDIGLTKSDLNSRTFRRRFGSQYKVGIRQR